MDKLDKYGKVMSVETYKLYYWFQRVLVFLFYQILWGVKIEGQENVSFSETYIILSNHCSNVDPPLVGFAVKRPIAYMAKSELFKVPILKQIIHWSGAYAVKRKAGDNSFIENTKYALDNGWLITIFPEGGRSPDGKFMPMKSGVARILLDTKVSFLPVAIIDSDKAWGKGKKIKFRQTLKVKIGKLVKPSDYMPSEDLTFEEKIDYIKNIYGQKILELLPEQHRPNV
ncbi:MAG: lysophospholipid acyltransferase family protein [Cyanobacteriota bacterium]|mgnify:CR=1 FL=1